MMIVFEILSFAWIVCILALIIYRLDLIMDKLEIPRWKLQSKSDRERR